MEAESQMIGKMIDSYEITELIGRGGMGVVYKARDVKLDRDVALKIMDPLLAREDAFLKRFWSEAKALAKLQNPYIVGIYALRETEFGICIVMEYVQGRTLGDLIKASGPLKPAQAVWLFKQLLLGFEHAHTHGIIHRDVKPGNILVTDDNVAKITDFGLAKIYQPSAATLTSITGGTLFYASPEQLEGLGKVDQRGDVYSLGMTFYESLTGAVPFANTESDFAIREKIVKGRIPSPRAIRPDIPSALSSIIMKAIEKDPQNRYQTAAEMREGLEHFETTLKQIRANPVRTSRRIVHPLWLLVPGAVVLIIAGILLFPAILAEKATISVRSEPSGAQVIIGDETLHTPADFLLPAGNYRIAVSQTGYSGKDSTVTVQEGDQLSLIFTLQAIASQTAQTLQPPIVVQPPTIVQPPIVERSEQKIVESKKVEPRKEPSLPPSPTPRQSTSISSKVGEEREPKGTGSIDVKVIPPNSRVSIDGVPVPSMPLRIQPGTHTVKVVSDESDPPGRWEGKITVQEGKPETVNVDFSKKVKITVAAVNELGKVVPGAKISCDGEQAPHSLGFWQKDVSFGFHRIVIKMRGFRDTTIVRCFENDMVAPGSALKVVLQKSTESAPDE